MLEIIAFPVAVLLGFLAGLGVGGGSLLVLWLTMAVGMEYADARTINLLFFLPCALTATLFNRKQGRVKFQKIWPAVICGCVIAALAAAVSTRLDTGLIKKFFGGLLLFTGLRELFYRPRKAK